MEYYSKFVAFWFSHAIFALGIYHIKDKYNQYLNDKKEEKRKELIDKAVFPCKLIIDHNCIIHKHDPIILGVTVVEGRLHIGTPIIIPSKNFIEIGTIISIQYNHKSLYDVPVGSNVAIKIDKSNYSYGKDFDYKDPLYSKITRESIDCLKEYFQDQITKDDRILIGKYKQIFNI